MKTLKEQLLETLKAKIKKGDRIGIETCGPKKSVFTFDCWDGQWMCSKTGNNEYHPINIYSINKEPISFEALAKEEEKV